MLDKVGVKPLLGNFFCGAVLNHAVESRLNLVAQLNVIFAEADCSFHSGADFYVNDVELSGMGVQFVAGN